MSPSISGSCLVPSSAQPRLPEASEISDVNETGPARLPQVDTPQSTPRLTRGRLTSVQTAALYWVSSRSVHNLGVLSTE